MQSPQEVPRGVYVVNETNVTRIIAERESTSNVRANPESSGRGIPAKAIYEATHLVRSKYGRNVDYLDRVTSGYVHFCDEGTSS